MYLSNILLFICLMLLSGCTANTQQLQAGQAPLPIRPAVSLPESADADAESTDTLVTRGELAAILVNDLQLTKYPADTQAERDNTEFRAADEFEPAVDAAGPPADIDGHEHRLAIATVIRYGLRGLEVFPDGGFHPERAVNRAELAMALEDILALITDTPELKSAFIGNASPFPDVRAEYYALNAIITVTSRNILTAGADGCFQPDRLLTRTEAITAARRLRAGMTEK